MSPAAGVELGFAVAGTIVISNPAPIAATISRITETLPGATNMVVSCAMPFTLGAFQQVTCTYSTPVSSKTNTTNQVEVQRSGRVERERQRHFWFAHGDDSEQHQCDRHQPAGHELGLGANGSQIYTKTMDCQNVSWTGTAWCQRSYKTPLPSPRRVKSPALLCW